MSSGDALLAWGREVLRRHEVRLDVLAAVLLTGAELGTIATLRHDRTVVWTVLSAVVCTGSVGWRRIAPTGAAIASIGAVAVYQISGQDPNGAFISVAIVLSCYMVGRLCRDRAEPIAVAVCGLAANMAIVADGHFSPGKVVLTWLPLTVLPIVAGRLVTRRDDMVRELHDVRERLQDERDVASARASVAERTRVARELHDVVAHCVSVMVIQAGAARLLSDTDVAAARAAMRVVVESGRTALTDLRRVVGVRRRGEDGGESAPGLAQLPHLVAQERNAQRSVRLHLDEAASVPPDLDLVAFRIVQEALTNARKHAPTASVDVSVSVATDAVTVSVVDSGPAITPTISGSGNGLIGMRERVTLCGGEMAAGPTADGGFAVRAHLPMTYEPVPLTPNGLDQGPLRRLSHLKLDMLLSLAWLVPLEIEAMTSTHRTGPLAWNVLAVAAMALAGVIRRRTPLAFLLVVGSLTIALSGGLAAPQRASVVGLYTLAVGSYAVSTCLRRNLALFGLGILVAGVVLTTSIRHASAGTALGGGLMACVVWICGRIVRNQRQLTADLSASSRRLAADRDERAHVALLEQRMRIARDLNTIIAGVVAGMVVRASAVDDVLVTDHVAASAHIASIEQAGRDALIQLRQMLGVLRSRFDPAPRQPHVDECPARDLLAGASA